MMRNGRHMFLGVLLIAASIATLTGTTLTAARQESGRSLEVFVLACETDPGTFSFTAGGEFPGGCTPVDAIPLSIETVDGFPIQACLTYWSEPACPAPIPAALAGTTVLVRADPGMLPHGFTARANPVVVLPGETRAGLVLLPAAAEPSSGSASLTIHSRVCPPDYAGSAWFADCHETPPAFAQPLHATGPAERSRLTDRDGNATFTGLPAGSWRIAAGLPDSTIGTFVFCSRIATPGVEYPSTTTLAFPSLPWTAVTLIDLAAGDDILCDLYAIPSSFTAPSAYLTIHARVCPEVLPDDQYHDACHDRGWAGGRIEVGISGGRIIATGYADQDGNRTFRVSPGSYFFGGPPGHWLADVYQFCSHQGEPAVALPLPVTLVAGDAVVCDFYFVGTTYR